VSKFIIHIGPHKTGSTYLQYGFFDNRLTLREQGVNYPTEWTSAEFDWNHRGLYRQLKLGDEPGVARDFESVRAAGYPVNVISCEDLSLLQPPALKVLAKHAGPESQIIFYVRRWSELLPSLAQEQIRQGENRLLPEILFDHMTRPFESDALNFCISLARFEEVFEKDALRLVSFNSVLENHLDIFQHFISEIVGADPLQTVLPQKKHSSLPIGDIELLRIMNHLFRTQAGQLAYWPAQCFTEALRTHPLITTRASMEECIRNIHINEFARPLEDLYTSIGARFNGRLVRPIYDNNLFKRIEKDLPFIDPSYLIKDGVLAEIRELFQALVHQPN
jgi:hypothetical protein